MRRCRRHRRMRRSRSSTSTRSRRTICQPRLQMDDARLEELAASIRSHGVIQPIVVRKTGDGYRIIAGERRWRAAQRAGLTRVPVVFKDVGGRAGVAGPARARADREHPARRPQPDRRGEGVPPSRRRVPPDAGRRRLGGRQGSRDGRQHAAAAQAARRSPERRRLVGALDGPRPRAARAAGRRRCSSRPRAK